MGYRIPVVLCTLASFSISNAFWPAQLSPYRSITRIERSLRDGRSRTVRHAVQMGGGPPQNTVVVTGASRGLGREIALQAARQGHQVIGLARRSDDLTSLNEELKACGGPFSGTVECDLSQPDSMSRATQQILMKTRHIAVLVHNAGQVGPVQPMSKVSTATVKECIDVNLVAVDYLTRRLLPLLGDHMSSKREEKSFNDSPLSSILKPKLLSRICILSSDAAHIPYPTLSTYCVAKAGLLMWGRCAALELAPHGISVVAIQPGVIDTRLQAQLRAIEPEDFPEHSIFMGYQTEGMLKPPQEVAAKLLPLILHHPASFSGAEFDVSQEDWPALIAQCQPDKEFSMMV